MIATDFSFSPILPFWLLACLGMGAFFLTFFDFWRKGTGAGWRLAFFVAFLLFLSGPRQNEEIHRPSPAVVVVIEDETASQEIAGRIEAVRATRQIVEAQFRRLPNLEIRFQTVRSDSASDGTRLFAALETAIADLPRRRVAGAILITDGLVHDLPEKSLGFPVHSLIVGERGVSDRRLIIEEAPAYGLVGGMTRIAFKIEDKKAKSDETAMVTVKREDGRDMILRAPLNKTTRLSLPVTRGGANPIFIEVEPGKQEISLSNNATGLNINGVRDRLKVALISGIPHMGGRAWRNLLKSDPAVDLVHFTIMRSSDKVDNIPSHELSLIAFPARELFQERLSEFDLMVFDRHGKRSIMADDYHRNIVAHVRSGGSLLMAAGPEFATLSNEAKRSPLFEILPIRENHKPQLFSGNITPRLTDIGKRHPITRDLPSGEWGSWLRRIDVVPKSGEVLLEDMGGHPLLIIDRVGAGRVAFLASDRAWLWNQGYQGGGPYVELMRRLIHWLMKEPELEEDNLRLTADNMALNVEWQSLNPPPTSIDITGPDGKHSNVLLRETKTGQAIASIPLSGAGLYQAKGGNRRALTYVAGGDPRELAELSPDDSRLKALQEFGGGLFWLNENKIPDFRAVEPGGRTYGRGWFGFIQGGDFTIEGIKTIPLLPPELALLILLALALAAWKAEGR
jgi:uncharacterized membrane protein